MNTKKSKQSKPKDKDSRYFEWVLQRIREIRASELYPMMKAAEIVVCAIDDDDNYTENVRCLWQRLEALMAARCSDDVERFVNRMLLAAERWVANHHLWSMKDIESNLSRWLWDINNNPQLYNHPSFRGVYDYDFHEDEFDEWDANVALPTELEDCKDSSMILIIKDMERLVDTFCSCNTYYRRAYDILAKLDKEVLRSLKTGVFKEWIYIPYKVGGVAMFQFSHFEVNLSEPDPQFRTLYVVYRYDTSAS